MKKNWAHEGPSSQKKKMIAHIEGEREMVHDKESHTPSTKNIHTLVHLDQGL